MIPVGSDKSGFEKIASPMQDEIAKGLGPNAEKILALVRAVSSAAAQFPVRAEW